MRFSCGTFEYIFDIYSELEAVGEVSYDQTVEDRVVAVLGTCSRPDEPREYLNALDAAERARARHVGLQLRKVRLRAVGSW